MAFSQITINFNTMPTDGEVLNLSDSSTSLPLNETFKNARNIAGQVTIPTFSRKIYQIDYPSNVGTENIGVRFMTENGYWNEVPLENIEQVISVQQGIVSSTVYSLVDPILVYISNGQAIYWPYANFYQIGQEISGSIAENYKQAFDFDYNNISDLFTVTTINGVQDSGLGTVIITAKYAGAVFVADIVPSGVTVTIYNDNSPVVVAFSPSILNYDHKQNETLPTKVIYISGNLWSVIGKPNLLLAVPAMPDVSVSSIIDGDTVYQVVSGSGSVAISVSLTSFYDKDIEFLPSDLAGEIVIKENQVYKGSVNFSIIVKSIKDYLIIPYENNDHAFTLDSKFFEIFSENKTTYFEFIATIITYDFFTNKANEYVFPQKIVLFKGKSKINLGQLIHRLMAQFENPNDSFLQYKPASLRVSCTEKTFVDASIVRSGITRSIPFFAGLSRGIKSSGFLDFNIKPNRVTKASFAILNIVVPDSTYELKTFKNGTLLSSSNLLTTTDHVLSKKVTFESFERGDIIEYVVDIIGENNADASKKAYIIFPEGTYSNMIVWENEFLLQSAIECTGTALIDQEGDFQSMKKYKNLVENLDYLSSTKESKLLINTGWLLFTDIDTIESLMRSKRAWLIQGDNTISLRPTAKKLPKKDLDQELISFPLEFTINRNYNEETYSL